MEDLPLGRIAALVPEFAVKELPLGRTLMISLTLCSYNTKRILRMTVTLIMQPYDNKIRNDTDLENSK